jgi:predicted RecB family nuclease
MTLRTESSARGFSADNVRRHHLSKSRFTAGAQCPRLLWWKVHERDAPELQPDKVLQDRFHQGEQVGAMARELFPGGILIDLPHTAFTERVRATQAAIESGAPAVFEASFFADDCFVAVDILLRENDGWRLIEVKSSSSQKPEHLIDAAVQVHVATLSGVHVSGVEIMHLNKQYVHPGPEPLLTRSDVTAEVQPLLADIPARIRAQLAVLDGELPDAPVGMHCHDPRECPFMDRCWPQEPDHIRRLYDVGPRKCHQYMTAGIHRIGDIPPTQKLPPAAQRQLRAMKDDCLVVEPGLARALEPFNVALGFLDFETVSRAVPVWDGLGPWGMAAAQFSYHQTASGGAYTHAYYLAEGSHDPQPELAHRMIEATRGAERVVTYSSFEKTRIRALQRAVPALRAELEELEGKLIDLLPVLRENVYHPQFQGSFSLKYVLTPLVPDLTYDDLVIVDGMVASVEIARLLFVAHKIPQEERDRVRQDLLNYCERDTWAMVKLLERLRELTGPRLVA